MYHVIYHTGVFLHSGGAFVPPQAAGVGAGATSTPLVAMPLGTKNMFMLMN